MSRRCVFLDRDGVINVSPPMGQYVNRPDDFQLIPRVVDWIRLFNALNTLVIVVTNQRGVALGVTRPEDLRAIHEKMTRELAKRGAVLDDVFVCPHGKDSCECRKPKPGLVYAAERRHSIDMEHSLLIGDSRVDRELAANCGLRFIEVRNGVIRDVFLGSNASIS